MKNRHKHFVIDGEAVVLGVDGISDFNALHSRRHDDDVQFCAFDILAEGGDDIRSQCARQPNGCWREGLKAFSSILSSAARSAPTRFGPLPDGP